LGASAAPPENALSALRPCNGFAGRSREGPFGNERAGDRCHGAGSNGIEITSRGSTEAHRNQFLVPTQAAVNPDPDDWSTFATDLARTCIACGNDDDVLEAWVGKDHLLICSACAENWRQFVWGDVLRAAA
jgi:hypothetical protein